MDVQKQPRGCHCFGMRSRSRYISQFPSGEGWEISVFSSVQGGSSSVVAGWCFQKTCLLESPRKLGVPKPPEIHGYIYIYMFFENCRHWIVVCSYQIHRDPMNSPRQLILWGRLWWSMMSSQVFWQNYDQLWDYTSVNQHSHVMFHHFDAIYKLWESHNYLANFHSITLINSQPLGRFFRTDMSSGVVHPGHPSHVFSYLMYGNCVRMDATI